jgi:hypothetical protein
MNQPKINIVDKHGKTYGPKNVISLNWNNDGHLWMILVDFMGSKSSDDFSPFYDYDNTGEFVNVHGNLKGTIIFN